MDRKLSMVDGRMDVGIGRSSLAPPAVASQLLRLDPLGVLPDHGGVPSPGLGRHLRAVVQLDEGARLELGRTRFADRPDAQEHSFGLLAEWWF